MSDTQTAEGRARESTTNCPCGRCESGETVRLIQLSDLRDLLSTIDALRSSYEERGRVIEALAKGTAACAWAKDDDGIWHTGCGRSWFFDTGEPSDNGAVFCHSCGGRLEVTK